MTDPNQTEVRAWSSHLPVLLAAVASSDGPVLELGVGHFSTPELHALCGALGKELVSVEDSLEWFTPFAKKYSAPGHQFLNVDYSRAHLDLADQNWGVVFIDHSPGGANRANAFSAFRDIAQFIVVHDYHLENSDAIAPMLVGMHFHVTTTYQPPTLIASWTQKIPESLALL